MSEKLLIDMTRFIRDLRTRLLEDDGNEALRRGDYDRELARVALSVFTVDMVETSLGKRQSLDELFDEVENELQLKRLWDGRLIGKR